MGKKMKCQTIYLEEDYCIDEKEKQHGTIIKDIRFMVKVEAVKLDGYDVPPWMRGVYTRCLIVPGDPKWTDPSHDLRNKFPSWNEPDAIRWCIESFDIHKAQLLDELGITEE